MNRLLFILCFIPLLFASCSKEDNDVSVVGTWKLTAWNITDGFDINKDGTVSTNILDEVVCENNETLIFETNGVISSSETYNPEIDIALLDGTTDEYTYMVTCDEQGVIGFATTYSQATDKVVFNDVEFTVGDKELFRVKKEAIKIYNETFTEVIATKDLTMVYTKQ
ncbi:hypothetical protein [Flavivirga eckloniae]|uniref:Lipocalin-like domain-containing protein n=1 Tax=Flavivirga eckloniae TaxID=1803846 RepID=A0A2K9PUR8_9FLAO|nr:hypothetical protein [Flavivirga eckloniae]AUP80811.1 hypothetical protein C1H87_19685 [Flavivirga eckloniae]